MTDSRSACPEDPRVQRLVHTFEELSPARLDTLAGIYHPGATFRDPFNAVQGLPAIQALFAHMYEALDDPHFRVTDYFVRGGSTRPMSRVALEWTFHFAFRPGRTRVQQIVPGMSVLKLDESGLITEHLDYWDAADGILARLPGIGVPVRWLQRRLAATAPQPSARR